jgi:hypothetical protein
LTIATKPRWTSRRRCGEEQEEAEEEEYLHGQVKRRAAVFFLGIDVRAAFKQQQGHIQVVIEHRLRAALSSSSSSSSSEQQLWWRHLMEGSVAILCLVIQSEASIN